MLDQLVFTSRCKVGSTENWSVISSTLDAVLVDVW